MSSYISTGKLYYPAFQLFFTLMLSSSEVTEGFRIALLSIGKQGFISAFQSLLCAASREGSGLAWHPRSKR